MKNTIGLSGTAGIAGEGVAENVQQREVQFVIERPCPQVVERFGWLPGMPDLPYPVWVFYPGTPIEATSYHDCDSATLYQATPEAYRALLAQCPALVPKGFRTGMFVCEHMGRIIE